jgi:hypothetical protein
MIAMKRNRRWVWPKAPKPGTFDITRTTLEGRPSVTARIEFICPRAQYCSAFIGPHFEARRSENEPNVWGWDGNADLPSLTPSINCIAEKDGKPTSGCGWHGFITKGEMR